HFSDVVIAVPGSAVLSIDGAGNLLSAEDQQFFQGCRYQRVLAMRVSTPRPVDGGCYAISIPRVENRSAATISFHDYIDSSIVPEGEGLLTIAGGGADVDASRLLDDLKALYPV